MVLARVQLTLAAVLVLVALLLSATLIFGDRAANDAPRPFTVSPSGFAGAVSPPGARATDFRLRDQDGAVVALAAERGRVTVLTFLYTTC